MARATANHVRFTFALSPGVSICSTTCSGPSSPPTKAPGRCRWCPPAAGCCWRPTTSVRAACPHTCPASWPTR
ncbi:hypothetical protein [Nonomuraea sp. NPDC049480]|uniref:hypothetical protein n=1 Tax=Nonomuraea sp. NPDC049480 TaxID=3364353 RepID=UPI0037AA0B0A